MTTFTLKDYIDNMQSGDHEVIQKRLSKLTWSQKIELMQTLEELEKRKLETKDASVTVEPIPFAGYVNIQDKEDTEKMLRDQLHFVNEQLQTMQAENQRLKRKLRALGENE